MRDTDKIALPSFHTTAHTMMAMLKRHEKTERMWIGEKSLAGTAGRLLVLAKVGFASMSWTFCLAVGLRTIILLGAYSSPGDWSGSLKVVVRAVEGEFA